MLLGWRVVESRRTVDGRPSGRVWFFFFSFLAFHPEKRVNVVSCRKKKKDYLARICSAVVARRSSLFGDIPASISHASSDITTNKKLGSCLSGCKFEGCL